MANNLSNVNVDNLTSSSARTVNIDKITEQVDTIARANNTAVDNVAYLNIGAELTGQEYLYDSSSETIYKSPVQLSGIVNDIVDRTITVDSTDHLLFKVTSSGIILATASELESITPKNGEVWFNTTSGTIQVGNGVTLSGVRQLSTENSNIVFKRSGSASAVENMIAGVPIAMKVGDVAVCEGGTIFTRISESSSAIQDFKVSGDIYVSDFGANDNANITTNINDALQVADNKYTFVKDVFNSTFSNTDEVVARTNTLILSNKYSSFKLTQEGTETNPVTANRETTSVVRKVVQSDDTYDHSHAIESGLFEVIKKGSGDGDNPIKSTVIVMAGNAVQDGTNTGTDTDQKWDSEGNTVGVTGFAVSNVPTGITTALWGYAESPTLNQLQLDNAPQFSTVGLETNVKLNHPDTGYKTILSGAGSSIGYLNFNYRDELTGVVDMTFGIQLSGNPNDGDYESTDVDNWNGFHVGINLDKIKNNGILFGTYVKDYAELIKIPNSLHGGNNVTGLSLGSTKINMGEYLGSDFNDTDMWQNGGSLFHKSFGVNRRIVSTDLSIQYTDMSSNISPGVDNTYSCGLPAERWSVMYAASNTINTSDERKKDEISFIDDAVLDAWENVNYSSFKYKESKEQKGENARIHFGLIAQKVRDCFENAGLDAFKYGLLCYDEWDDEYKTIPAKYKDVPPIIKRTNVAPKGNKPFYKETVVREGRKEKVSDEKVVKVRSTGNCFGLRYEQCLVLEAALMRRETNRLRDRIDRLEK